MMGVIADVLTECYGTPQVAMEKGLKEFRWNFGDQLLRCVMYMRDELRGKEQDIPYELRSIYGDCLGGYLIGGSLKVATRLDKEIYGLYTLHSLLDQSEVRQASAIDDEVFFFMDAANVWFYGCKQGHLWVFDAETGELDNLGGIRSALKGVVQAWEKSALESS